MRIRQSPASIHWLNNVGKITNAGYCLIDFFLSHNFFLSCFFLHFSLFLLYQSTIRYHSQLISLGKNKKESIDNGYFIINSFTQYPIKHLDVFIFFLFAMLHIWFFFCFISFLFWTSTIIQRFAISINGNSLCEVQKTSPHNVPIQIKYTGRWITVFGFNRFFFTSTNEFLSFNRHLIFNSNAND